ncbi:hypothetical protein X994_6522 (plasmid) [Burkholderia pseudomallei]|uniref:hypothetical protein n=1 Tax=Burkholderia pseudomallei TaxID=28450 RepID=UPI00052ABBAC|nr:hypothetical protein [Burkholderia pseudomallei]AIV73751.1 hypothetical protein X994_6522 [Burkholderia pseudomallei]
MNPFFSRYLVALGCWDYTPAVVAANAGKPYLRSFSGFLVSIRGTSWSVMTASHAIRDLLDLDQQGHDLGGWHVDDSPIQRPPEGLSVPLLWDFESIAYLHDAAMGFDFALVPLTPMEQALLASNGVCAITEAEIADPYVVEFDRWCLLGLPDAKARPDHTRQVVEKHFLGLAVDPLPDRPDWWPSDSNPQFPMKYGLLMATGDPDIDSLSIAGMSGGPVIGLRETPSGTAEWKLIAIQSGWVETRRAISAFAAKPVFDCVGRMIDDQRGSAGCE